jgi:rhodanese-related sulfurtransferase/tetratricopeptide (TPR) repeat protein
MKRVNALIPFLLAGIAACAAAQDADLVLKKSAEYATAREEARYTVPATEAPARLRKPRPLILDVRPRTEYDKVHLRGSLAVPFPELFTPAGLARLPMTRRIVVVDGGDEAAIEAMVLLRLAGYDATALSGGVPAIAAEIAHAPAPAPGEEPKPVAEGPGAEQALAQPSAAPVPPPRPAVPLYMWVALGAAALALAGMAFYFLVLLPKKKNAPLREAMRMLAGESPDLVEAEALLQKASNAGLKDAALDDCRFLLAYVRARLGRYEQAMTVTAELITSGRAQAEALYLDLWLKVHEKKYDDAERRIAESGDAIGDLLDAKRLTGILFLEQGRLSLSRGDVDRALTYFERLRALDVLTDRVPKDLDDHELAVAIQALVEAKVPEAQKHFENTLAKAKERGASTVYSRIGLLLCRWKAEELPDIDRELGELAGEVQSGAAAFQKELVRHVLLWHAASLLFSWLRLPKDDGLPAQQARQLDERLDRVRSADSEMPDPDFIAGLIAYYFAKTDEERAAAVEKLKQAAQAGVSVPGATLLVEAEDKLAQLAKERHKRYLELLKAYLRNGAVSIDLRRELAEHLRNASSYYKEALADIDLDATPEDASPSIRDLAASCEMIEDRVRRIFKGFHGKTKEKSQEGIDDLVNAMAKTREQVAKGADELGKTGKSLMQIAGEALLSEEPPKEAEFVAVAPEVRIEPAGPAAGGGNPKRRRS